MKLFFLSIFAFFSGLFRQPIQTNQNISITPSPTQIASPSASPTPKPLTFNEMNQLYGPCTATPILMYHHINTAEAASAGKYGFLNVTPDMFDKHMAHLSAKGYTTISPADLVNFFTGNTKLPTKAIMLTFDDAYADFGDQAVPILSKYNFKATVFAPTGLLENPGYMTWSRISNLGSNIYIGNHTWSHHNVVAKKDVILKEVSTATTQLNDHGLDPLKIFAYPYGTVSNSAVSTIKELGFKLALTTKPGRILCAKQALTLPRIRIGNSSLGGYGL